MLARHKGQVSPMYTKLPKYLNMKKYTIKSFLPRRIILKLLVIPRLLKNKNKKTTYDDSPWKMMLHDLENLKNFKLNQFRWLLSSCKIEALACCRLVSH